MAFDKRLTPARPDLAAAHLKGHVEAARFAPGEKFSVSIGRAGLRAAPSENAAQDSELLFGEGFIVYERADGWAWGQAQKDLYVGYLREAALAAPFTPDAHVVAMMAPVFPGPDLKLPVKDFLPLNAVARRGPVSGAYVEIAPGSFVPGRHLAPLEQKETDFVAVAERFVGVPYVWGGKTFAGADCSGLIQTALAAAGISAPRDTDMQENALGRDVAAEPRRRGDLPPAPLRRGDLIFWKGHMGVMLDAARLLHANAFHMQVAIEPLADAIARIEKLAGPVTSVKRL